MSIVKRWYPNPEDKDFHKMPGDFIYISDREEWQKHKAVVIRMLDILTKLGFIRGTATLTEQGLYIDYRLPPSTHKF